MSYDIMCSGCQEKTWAANIVDLIDNHTDSVFGEDGGMLVCEHCKGPGYVFQESRTQEGDEMYTRYVKGVVRINTGKKTFSPYVFLNSEKPNTEVSHIHLCYYKDTRDDGGRLKHGHGLGGPPAYWKGMFDDLLMKLLKARFVSKDNLIRIAKECDQK